MRTMSRQGYPVKVWIESVAITVAATSLFACSTPPDSSQSDRGPIGGAAGSQRLGAVEGVGRQEVPPTTFVDARPAALVQGRVVDWGELRPLLSEAAGADALQEVVLDRMLQEELAEAGNTVSTDDVEGERELFYAALSADPNVAARLAREVRARQGLGVRRFDRLLRRNAQLRALVRDQVQITEEAVQQMYKILHGPKRQARLMVLSTLRDAQTAIRRVRGGELFADVAVEISTDASAPRGGLLEPVSRADASYPAVMREALWSLEPGEVSSPVFLGDQYAVLMLVDTVDGDGTDPATVRGELTRQVRLNQERLLMDALARRLLADATITIIDDAIRWSWESKRRQAGTTSR